MALGVLVSGLLAALIMPFADRLLGLVGAQGEALRVAHLFLMITLPSNVLLGLGMMFTGLLRAQGDAVRAMWVTLGGAIVTAILDPLLIFGRRARRRGGGDRHRLHRSRDLRRNRLAQPFPARPDAAGPGREVVADAPAMASIAGPAVLTNLAPRWRAPSLRTFSPAMDPMPSRRRR